MRTPSSCGRKLTALWIIAAIGLSSGGQGCSSGSDRAALERQLNGVAYISKMAELVHALQNYRSQAIAYVEGDGRVEFGATEQRISEIVTFIDRYNGEHSELKGVSERWVPFKGQVWRLMEGWRDQPRECFQRHTELISTAISLMSYLDEASSLQANDSPDIQSLTAAATTVIPEMMEAMSQTNDMVTHIAAQGGMVRDSERELFKRDAMVIQKGLEQTKANYDKAYAADQQIQLALDTRRAAFGQLTSGFLTALNEQVIQVDYVTVPPDVWSPRAKAAIESAQELQDQSLHMLRTRLIAQQKRS